MDSYIINLSVIELDYDTHALQVDRGKKTYTLQYVSHTFSTVLHTLEAHQSIENP